jgi:hypothetical protein
MKKYVVAIFVISVSSLSMYTLLTNFNLIDQKTFTALTVLSVAAFGYASYYLIKPFEFSSPFFKYLFYIFMFYEFTILIRGVSLSYENIKFYIQSGIIFWPIVIPVFVYFDKKISTMVLFIKWVYKVGLFFLFLCLVFPTLLIYRLTAETTISIVTVCGFLLLNANYLNYRKVYVSFTIIIISLLSVIYLARRSSILTLSGFILASYFLNITNNSKTLLFRFFPILVGIMIFMFLYIPDLSSSLTTKIGERLKEDSRSELFEMFFFQMRDDMVFGKGMNGSYYYPSGGELEDEGITFAEEDYRNLIENGYLQLLLNGGITQIVLFLMVTIPAIILGLFKSSNQFTKACAILILLWLLDMIAYGLPRFILQYVLVWISVGICYNSNFRNATDQEISEEFEKIGIA